MLSTAAVVRYMSHTPTTMWVRPSSRPQTAEAMRGEPKLAKNSQTYTAKSPTNNPPTGLSCAPKKTTAPSADSTKNGIAMNEFGRGSPPNVLLIPSAHQCTPYAVNATAAMYSGLPVKEPNQVRPTNRMTPVTNWRNPGI